MRVYLAVVPKNKDGVRMPKFRILPSGSLYEVMGNGSWKRVNHPLNKHQRTLAHI